MTEYLDLWEYLYIAEAVTGISWAVLETGAGVALADSALNAPQASFGGVEFYPSFPMKAAVLCSRLARNHPLPDGNKRSAWISMRQFCLRNGYGLQYDDEDAERVVNAVATGEMEEEIFAAWIAKRLVTQPLA